MLTERFQMVIKVGDSILVSFTSEFRNFGSKLESADKSTTPPNLRRSAHPSFLNLLESSFSVGLVVTAATYGRRVSAAT